MKLRKILSCIMAVMLMLAIFTVPAFAEGEATTDGTGATPGSGSTWILLVVWVLVIVLLFWLPSRQNKKQQKKKEEMLNNLRINDEITTSSGILGRVVKVKDDVVTIETSAQHTQLRILKWAIVHVESDEELESDTPAPNIEEPKEQ
ncbi:MAG: preprotein translocase subunit YajC [Clostridia bacterium]|nr:preprotein translocase subunit YajC [Clostridia bacterium]